MDNINFTSNNRDWKFWTNVVFYIIGAILFIVGFIANMVEMGRVLGYISLLAFITWHWSFWLVLFGAAILISLLIANKIFGQKSKKDKNSL